MDIRKISPHLLRTSRNNLKTSSKVGRAVYDILQKDNPSQTVQEVLDASAEKFRDEMEKAIQENFHKYESPFYILVLSKKEPWALNVMRNWFIARQTRPTVAFLRHEFPTFMSTLYRIDKKNCELKIVWSLPIEQDCRVVMKNRHLYDPQLVKWVQMAQDGSLDAL